MEETQFRHTFQKSLRSASMNAQLQPTHLPPPATGGLNSNSLPRNREGFSLPSRPVLREGMGIASARPILARFSRRDPSSRANSSFDTSSNPSLIPPPHLQADTWPYRSTKDALLPPGKRSSKRKGQGGSTINKQNMSATELAYTISEDLTNPFLALKMRLMALAALPRKFMHDTKSHAYQQQSQHTTVTTPVIPHSRHEPSRDDPIISTLAGYAAVDVNLRNMMRQVALGKATHIQLAAFQAILNRIAADIGTPLPQLPHQFPPRPTS